MENRGARLLLEVAIGFVLLGILLLPRWMNRPAAKAPAARPAIEHVVLVVLPRGEPAEAAVHEVARRGVLLANSHALAHPALPNRLALVAGSAWGVHADTTPPIDVRHIGDLLETRRLTWQVCADDRALVAFEAFARKTTIVSLAQCDALRGGQARPPAAGRERDRRGRPASTETPAFAYVAASTMPRFELPPHTLLIVTIDEGRGDTNDILTAIAGDGVRAGGTSRRWYDHYSVLRTIEELLHLGTLTEHDAKADVIDDIWR